MRGHVTPAVSPRTFGNRLLVADNANHVCPGVVKVSTVEGNSDENRFCLYASDGRKHVRRRPGERHLP